ncbi:LOW QUALITY PROTEIN: free fatty acid receptor 2 [Xenentodon cancila]
MESVVESKVILSGYIISFLAGFPANLLALYAFNVKVHSKPLPTDILLLNLTISDLLLLILLPLKMHEAASSVSILKWTLPTFLCSITSFTFFSIIYTSWLLLMAVSVVRFTVVFPVTFQRLQKPVYPVVVTAVIWVISAGHCSITFIVLHHPSLASSNHACYENFTQIQLDVLLPVRLEMFFVFYLFPLIICIYCYLHLILTPYSRLRISMQKRKAIGFAAGTLAVLLICVLPYNSSHFLGYMQNKSLEWRYYTPLLSSFNTCTDLIFFFFSSIFRITLKKSFFRRYGLDVAKNMQRQGTNSR